MIERRGQRGTTLIEIMVAIVFIAACSSAILKSVWMASLQSGYALRRSRVMSYLQSQIEGLRASASTGSLANQNVSAPVTLPGFTSQVTITTSATLESNSLELYDVVATATWTEEALSGTRTDTASLSTVVMN